MNAVRLPLEIEREFEEFIPEIGGYRKRLVADEGSNKVLRRVKWARGEAASAAPARRRRHGSHFNKCRKVVSNAPIEEIEPMTTRIRGPARRSRRFRDWHCRQSTTFTKVFEVRLFHILQHK
ncbi:hypothetical protein TB2_021773 [Malus domestica]